MNENLVLLENTMKSFGLSIEDNLNAETVIDMHANPEVRYAFVNAIRKEIELKIWIEKYGADKKSAVKHSFPNIKVLHEKTLVLSSGNFSH